MKVLLINQTFYPDPSSTAQYLTDFALDLVKRGCQVTVLTSRRGYVEPYPLYPSRESFHGIKIIRVCPIALSKNSRFTRVMQMLSIHVCFSWQLFWLRNYDRIVSLTSPPMLGFVSLMFAQWRRIPLVYWVMDMNPDQLIQAGWISKMSFIGRCLKRMRNYVLEKASQVIVLDVSMKERLLREKSVGHKIHVIPPWIHTDHIDMVPHNINPFRSSNNFKEKFVVMYSGNHSLCHPLDTILQAARELKYDPWIQFVFIGGGVRAKEVDDFKKKYSLANLIRLPYVNRDEMKYSLSAADLHLVVMGEPYVGIVHPSKIYQIIKIGRPFAYIGPKDAPIRKILEDYKIGFHIDLDDVEGLVNLIEKLRQMQTNHEERVQIAQKKIMDAYSRKILSGKLMDLVCNN